MTRLRSAFESFRESLFYLPSLFVLGAIALSEGMVFLDGILGAEGVPGFFESTVDSSRQVLGAIATAVITVAGVVFSVMVISVQLASSQYSPRILRGFLRDRLEQVVMGLMVGTFTYTLLVLRKVRGDETPGGEFVPHLAVALGVVLGVAAALAILAFIDRAARMMQIGNLIGQVAEETLATIRNRHPERGTVEGREDPVTPPGPGVEVRSWENGWLQHVDDGGLMEAVPRGGTVRLEARVGTFVPRGVPVCTLWPPPEDEEAARKQVRQAVALGGVRTMQQDVAFGIRQLADVALRALSTGVNDPTTAYEVIAHLGAILRELLLRDLPPRVVSDDHGRRVLRPKDLDHRAFVDRAFDQIRVAGAGQPAVAIYLLTTLAMLVREVGEEAGMPDRAERLRWHAGLVLAQCEAAGPLPEDLERVRAAAAEAGVAPAEHRAGP